MEPFNLNVRKIKELNSLILKKNKQVLDANTEILEKCQNLFKQINKNKSEVTNRYNSDFSSLKNGSTNKGAKYG